MEAEISPVETNMVFLSIEKNRKERLKGYLLDRGFKTGDYGHLRLVTHHDVDAEDIPVVVEAVKKFVTTDEHR